MKKLFILTISLMLIILLAIGCDNSQVDAPEIDSFEDIEEVIVEGGTKIEYAREYEEDIFGDLSIEEIEKIIDEIFKKVSKNDNSESNIGLIIEEVFKEYGITDEDKLNAAKSKITISKTK
ncbi:hypothetical protein CIW83_01205 [Tissierella sp. P1]|uniref:hypothetical protein n=1 Tax=Tissierella TaxID=41273 RepID=UPI000B9FD7C3|nr:hypothetical protein [Tissierella sp. P1]OZV14071.1 hypothetical protein CIW83_01205 [Tissierella sp. P1]